MKLNVESKLLKIISEFGGMTLKAANFKETTIDGKKLLVLELTFSDEGIYRKMILVLNKDITEKDYKKVSEALCQ